jgi:pyruvate/2-oxoglutarate dehydrogenase complex dihydrolipoamide acyltransferase (E2) component
MVRFRGRIALGTGVEALAGKKPVEHQSELCLRDRVVLSLTFDQRLLDGGPAARFLQRVSELVEKPHLLLV